MTHYKQKSLWSAAVVLALEAYDFVVFLFLARGANVIFSFKSENKLVLVTDVLLGVLARPLGGFFLGSLADRYGRKPLLIFTAFAMAISTFCFAVIPNSTHDLSSYAPIMLVVFKAIQGMIFGSDLIISKSYFAELAPKGKVGLYASLSPVCQEIGTILAVLVSFSVFVMPGNNLLYGYSWRIPFISGAFSMLIGFHLRMHLIESPLFKKSRVLSHPIKELFKHYKMRMLKSLCVIPVVGTSFYLFRVFILNQAEIIEYLSVSSIFILSVITGVVSTLTAPLGGYLSDLVGRKPIMISSVMAILLLSWPMLVLINHVGSAEMIFVRMLVGQVIISIFTGLYTGALSGFIVEMFPTHVRISGLAFTYNLTMGFIAGVSPLLNMLGTKNYQIVNIPGKFLTISALLALIVLCKFVKESHNMRLDEWKET